MSESVSERVGKAKRLISESERHNQAHIKHASEYEHKRATERRLDSIYCEQRATNELLMALIKKDADV